MTMPHLENCRHKDDGWCSSCVKEAGDESLHKDDVIRSYRAQRDAALARAEKAEARADRLAAECEAWRKACDEGTIEVQYDDHDQLYSQQCIYRYKQLVGAARAAVDAHGDLKGGG